MRPLYQGLPAYEYQATIKIHKRRPTARFLGISVLYQSYLCLVNIPPLLFLFFFSFLFSFLIRALALCFIFFLVSSLSLVLCEECIRFDFGSGPFQTYHGSHIDDKKVISSRGILSKIEKSTNEREIESSRREGNSRFSTLRGRGAGRSIANNQHCLLTRTHAYSL